MKRIFVQDIQGNMHLQEAFLVAKREVATTRNGDPFLKLELSDKSGTISARAWSDAPAMEVEFAKDDFILILGRAEVWQNKVQIQIEDIRRLDESQIELDDYLPASRFDRDLLFEELKDLIRSDVRSHWIRSFLLSLLNTPWVVESIRLAPASTKNHHNYVGGLVEHVLSMARLALDITRHYARYYPGLFDGDLVVAGVLLHDLGKLTELSYRRAFAYTDEGKLLGHLVTGVDIVRQCAEGIEGFPAELELQLKHLVVAHHGKLEYGSPQRPQTFEALMLHMIDMMDSRAGMCETLRKRTRGNQEHDPQTGGWSDFSRPLEGRFLLPPVAGYTWAAPPEADVDDVHSPGRLRHPDAYPSASPSATASVAPRVSAAAAPGVMAAPSAPVVPKITVTDTQETPVPPAAIPPEPIGELPVEVPTSPVEPGLATTEEDDGNTSASAPSQSSLFSLGD